ncbi:MarR family transcriptional regulator [Rhizobium sp. CG4]|uniref:bifunctional helix-turn-helix transcriptional regulator/GNAT family N-acetyltransferase n=1 Tax=unclassified Rhizobium TaxID=2613769 RepID=UPI002033DFD6|nr:MULTISPECIES: helix-turn-helix domain-containing GNAT family N-acetyltransferase [unclassified Rhizobium]MCM2454802.1 MarR family transcriptional regulator [Rhizobium sp. CG4]MCS4242646.1 DNA-binding MarR family transcriptional regulator/GNAT superfamily N-acetyltransferase [Rhizobium sp. BIGb0125]
MAVEAASQLIDHIRATSRHLVRELGFMGGDFAGTNLPPSAVHALIEIEKGGMTARDLAAILRLEKSSVSRMLRKLVEAGDVREAAGEEDTRTKRLSLTPAGQQRVASIHAFARAQVSSALGRLHQGQHETVLEGMRLYADALLPRDQKPQSSPVEIVTGYRPGIIARITEMHALYYARTSDFGQAFESRVAGGLAEFCGRLENPQNRIWAAMREGQVRGSVAIDGEDLGEGIAHLRWFITDDTLRGTGAGKKLLDAAMDFVDASGFTETHLWTFAGLNAARHLYETRGFVLVEEYAGSQWGREVLEQRFVRKNPQA